MGLFHLCSESSSLVSGASFIAAWWFGIFVCVVVVEPVQNFIKCFHVGWTNGGKTSGCGCTWLLECEGFFFFTTFCVKQIILLISVNSHIPCKESYEGQASSEVYDDDDDYQMMTSCWWNFFFLPHQRQGRIREWTNCFGSRWFNRFLNFLLSFLLPSSCHKQLPGNLYNNLYRWSWWRSFFIAYCPFSFLFFTFFDDNQSEDTCTITMVTDFSKCGLEFLLSLWNTWTTISFF